MKNKLKPEGERDTAIITTIIKIPWSTTTTGNGRCAFEGLSPGRMYLRIYIIIIFDVLLQIKTKTVRKKMPSTKINGVPIISFIKSAGACISKCGGGGTIASSAERLSSRSCRIVAGRARYLAKDPFSDYKSTFLSSALKFLIRTARVR